MDFFMLDAGTSTVSCLALLALRMRVSISAMGSVICMDLTSYIRVTDICLLQRKVSELGNFDLLTAGIIGAGSAFPPRLWPGVQATPLLLLITWKPFGLPCEKKDESCTGTRLTRTPS